MKWSAPVTLVVALALAGCGGSSHHTKSAKGLTVPAYGTFGGFSATTITVTQGSPAYCRRDADAFVRNGKLYLRPFPSDADNYLVIARVQFIDFKAHRCNLAILRSALAKQLTPKQRRTVIRSFSFLGPTAARLDP
jgi:hypothetical protein